ncbi:MAG: cellulase family glycosylhydrolase [Clostridiales bacterium]|nr:cellulase family glycosylhydrolase [Clostridiales bacterium]
MEKIRGANLGNWLVLEEWMDVGMFEGTGAKDEVWLNRLMDKDALAQRMKAHRDTYVTEQDFQDLSGHGVNLVRIPVPYFIFGDRPPFNGCIEYLDMAFQWAEKYGIKVLIDLHTVPDSQNGYDNGGITGVCKWCQEPEEVEFALTVLERLAQRYKDHPALFGIEVLNEPISLTVWLSSPSGPIRGKPVDKEEAKGSSYVPMKFLKPFYREAYRRLRAILSEETAIVFHDGFRLTGWNRFFDESGMKNVFLDTHIYIFAMESSCRCISCGGTASMWASTSGSSPTWRSTSPSSWASGASATSTPGRAARRRRTSGATGRWPRWRWTPGRSARDTSIGTTSSGAAGKARWTRSGRRAGIWPGAGSTAGCPSGWTTLRRFDDIALTGQPSAETDCAEKPTVCAKGIEKHSCICYNKVTRLLEVISEARKENAIP